MKTYTITLTEEERAAALHCIARVEHIISIQYETASGKGKKEKLRQESERMIALWQKIKTTPENQ